MKPLTVTLDVLPPSVNHMYATAKGGGKYLTPEAVAFRDTAISQVRVAAARVGWQAPERIAFHLRITFPNYRQMDIDNRIKSALDACALALGFNDSRVDCVIAERVGVVKGRPECQIILMEMHPIGY
jgi:Holliday junction resolvase RusA-like endonuclease